MTETPESTVIPLERYPEPACGYTVDEGVLRIQDTNDPFETTFKPVPDATEMGRAFAAAGIEHDMTVTNSLLDRIRDDDRFTVTDESADSARVGYVVRPVNLTADTGVLLFVRTDGAPSADDATLGVDHVAGVISHDLRNPLDVAKARLEAARERTDDEHLEHVEQAHERMDQIIDDVLTLARGEDVVNPDGHVELDVVARSAWETVETENARLTVEDTLPTVLGDRDRVTRLFENLFRNAVEHGTPSNTTPTSAESAITVTVGTLDGGFYVEDDGQGIPPSERDRVFEPGYTSHEHGTGLGLAIVARIADVHDWTVDVTAEQTGGARFEVTGLSDVPDQ